MNVYVSVIGYVYTETFSTENSNSSSQIHVLFTPEWSKCGQICFQFENLHENIFSSKMLSKVEMFENATNKMQFKSGKSTLPGVVYKKFRSGLGKPW